MLGGHIYMFRVIHPTTVEKINYGRFSLNRRRAIAISVTPAPRVVLDCTEIQQPPCTPTHVSVTVSPSVRPPDVRDLHAWFNPYEKEGNISTHMTLLNIKKKTVQFRHRYMDYRIYIANGSRMTKTCCRNRSSGRNDDAQREATVSFV